MDKDEALRMALEALEIGKPMFDAYWGGSQFDQAITAIKEALAQPEKDIPRIGCVNHDCDKCKAQPEQKPVAWGNLANWCLDSDRVLITDKDKAAKYNRDVYDLTPLYTHPPVPTAQPEQEPSYWLGYGLQAHTEKPFEGATPVYTTQPQRKPLTDEQKRSIVNANCPLFGEIEPYGIIDDVEAAHGIKEKA